MVIWFYDILLPVLNVGGSSPFGRTKKKDMTNRSCLSFWLHRPGAASLCLDLLRSIR